MHPTLYFFFSAPKKKNGNTAYNTNIGPYTSMKTKAKKESKTPIGRNFCSENMTNKVT